MGGVNNSLRDDDVQLVFGNPAVVNGKMAKTLGMTVNPSFAGILQYNTAYADSLKSLGNVFTTVQYLDYGKLRQTDETSYYLGDFNASQYAIGFGTSQRKGNFHLGAYLRWAGFQIQSNQSFALLADLGVHYQHPVRLFSFGMAVKNIGRVLKRFDNDQAMPVPLNIQASISYKLQHMPLRFSVTGFYLQKPDIQYVDPNAPGVVNINGIEEKEQKKLSEQIARHLVFGGEFLLHRSFHLRVGYNHLRRKELRPETGAGLTGFSLGAGIQTKPVTIAYTYGAWQSAGGQHFISLNCRFSEFFTRQ